MKESRSVRSTSISGILAEVGKLQHERVEAAALDPQLALLRRWQSKRLATTYSDLSRSARYRQAMQFFLQDIYSERDYSQRNKDMERMYETLRHLMPEAVIRPLVLTVQLHYLTEQLDRELLDMLVNRLNMQGLISVPLYAEAYRLCDNYALRVKQIDLICEIGELVDESVRMPGSGMALRLGRIPLERAGWGELAAMMERGYHAFKHMRGAGELLNTIRTREMQILDRIYAGDSNPFDL